MQRLIVTLTAFALSATVIVGLLPEPKQTAKIHTPLFSGTPMAIGDGDDPNARANWDLERLKDPATGKIPANIRMQELAYAATLPKNTDRTSFTFQAMGPYNVGGRTRAMQIDVTNDSIILAGGVSGGMWKSVDAGQSWYKVTAPEDHHAVSCLVQDTRPGKTDTWYYGSGEILGNSASASFSANYVGNGLYKSTDGGETWASLLSTVSGDPQSTDEWDLTWNIALDPSNTTEDEIYAAGRGRIYRSVDGGQNWSTVLGVSGLSSTFMDLAVTSDGVVYATLSSGGGSAGIWRSPDGTTWTKIDPGSSNGFPANYDRFVIGIDPQNEKSLYLLGNTPGSGLFTNVFFGGTAWTSLWHYRYVQGDGSGNDGIWTDLSLNLPNNLGDFGNFYSQGSYDLCVAVKPDDSTAVFIGGTNLYRSTDGFTTPNNIAWIGGYEPFTQLPYFEIYEKHHPDQHVIRFEQGNPDVLISANDGGMGRTEDCMATDVTWTSLNRGYQTTQFYTIAIDQGTVGSNVIVGGTQDNGTWWTDSDDPTALWTFPSTGDGAHCAVVTGGTTYYMSRQRGKVLKIELDANGEVVQFNRIDPAGGNDYLFINPFILDPNDENVMYLAEGGNLWRNDSLDQIPYDNQYDSISLGWMSYSNLVGNTPDITALAASVRNPEHRLYFGTRSRRIYRMDSANVGDPVAVDITGNINSGNYTHCIAVHPYDADQVMVAYSNYNAISLWYTDNGGQSWEAVSGNLEVDSGIPGAPPGFGPGPSVRWATFIPDGDETSYLIGTSTGLYSTDELQGDATVWAQEGVSTVGNVVVDVMAYRPADGFLAIGTHGAGVYTAQANVTSVPEQVVLKDAEFGLFPNPSDGRMTVDFELTESKQVHLQVFDQQGRLVAAPWNGNLPTGAHRQSIDAGDLADGIYFLRLTAGSRSFTRKVVISR